MEFNEVIKNRRSIREYKDLIVSDEDIKQIINAGILAPSAKNKQPWDFIVIKDNNLKQEIGSILYDSDERKSPALIRTSEIIKKAPVLILVFNKIVDDELDWYSLSIGACIQNMLLQATNLGLGSLWIGYVNRIGNEINNLFDINDKKLISAIILGYKDEEPSSRPRNSIEDIVEWR